MPASGHQDHTASPSASGALVSRTVRVHRIPLHVRDDRERPSERSGTGRACRDELPDGTSGMFFSKGLDDPNHVDPPRQIGFCAQAAGALVNRGSILRERANAKKPTAFKCRRGSWGGYARQAASRWISIESRHIQEWFCRCELVYLARCLADPSFWLCERGFVPNHRTGIVQPVTAAPPDRHRP
jgi:hypothetical protein